MKQSVLLVFIVLLLCNWKKSKSETDFIPVEDNVIPAIIKTVILQDSLDVLQTKNGVRMLCEDLIRVNIYFIFYKEKKVCLILLRHLQVLHLLHFTTWCIQKYIVMFSFLFFKRFIIPYEAKFESFQTKNIKSSRWRY